MPSVHIAIEEANNFEIACKIDSWSSNFTVKWLQVDAKNESTTIRRSIDSSYQIETNSTHSVLKIVKVNKSLHNFKFKCIVNTIAYSVYDELVKYESIRATDLNVLCKLNFFSDYFFFLFHFNFKQTKKLNPSSDQKTIWCSLSRCQQLLSNALPNQILRQFFSGLKRIYLLK